MESAPPLDFLRLDGRVLRLSDLRGGAVILSFLRYVG
jgi:hypothetical protein